MLDQNLFFIKLGKKWKKVFEKVGVSRRRYFCFSTEE